MAVQYLGSEGEEELQTSSVGPMPVAGEERGDSGSRFWPSTTGRFTDGASVSPGGGAGRTWKGVSAVVKDTGGQGSLPAPASRQGQSVSCVDWASVAGRGTSYEQTERESAQCHLQAERWPQQLLIACVYSCQ